MRRLFTVTAMLAVAVAGPLSSAASACPPDVRNINLDPSQITDPEARPAVQEPVCA